MKIAIQTLGCKVNQSESASIEGNLRNHDFEIVMHGDNPDICIINTCTVTAKSDYQSRQLIRKAARSGAKVIVTGCYAQLKPDELTRIEGVSHVVGNADKSNISRLIKRLHVHGLIKKIKNSYKYYLTKLGKRVIAAALKINEYVLVPQLDTV